MKKFAFTILVLTLGIIVGHVSSLALAAPIPNNSCVLEDGELNASIRLNYFTNEIDIRFGSGINIVSIYKRNSRSATIEFEK